MDEEMKPLTEEELEELLGPFRPDNQPLDLDSMDLDAMVGKDLQQPQQQQQPQQSQQQQQPQQQQQHINPTWVAPTGSVLFPSVVGGNLSLPFQQTTKYDALEDCIRGRRKNGVKEEVEKALKDLKEQDRSLGHMIDALVVMKNNLKLRIREFECLKRRSKNAK